MVKKKQINEFLCEKCSSWYRDNFSNECKQLGMSIYSKVTPKNCPLNIEEREKMKNKKWNRDGERGTMYRRKYPDSHYHRIVTKKAKFLGQLMYCVLVAGGAPGWFRYQELRHRSMEDILDSLLPNNVNFHITYDGPKKFEKCTDCGCEEATAYGGSHPYYMCHKCLSIYPQFKNQVRR